MQLETPNQNFIQSDEERRREKLAASKSISTPEQAIELTEEVGGPLQLETERDIKEEKMSSAKQIPQTGVEAIEISGIETEPEEQLYGLMGAGEHTAQEQVEFWNWREGLKQWEAKIAGAKDKDLEQLVKDCEDGIVSDPFVKKYPGLKAEYQEVRLKALANLKDKSIDIIAKKIKEAKKIGGEQENLTRRSAANDLNTLITAWRERYKDENTVIAEKEKLGKLISYAEDLRDAQIKAH